MAAPPKVKIFFLTDVQLMVSKMTAQNTRTQQKKREHPSLPGGRENYEKLPKTPNQTKPPDFDTFLQISRLSGKLGRSRFFC